MGVAETESPRPNFLSYKVFTRSHPENRFTFSTFSFFREADFLPFDAGFANSTLVPETGLWIPFTVITSLSYFTRLPGVIRVRSFLMERCPAETFFP